MPVVHFTRPHLSFELVLHQSNRVVPRSEPHKNVISTLHVLVTPRTLFVMTDPQHGAAYRVLEGERSRG